MYSNVDVGDREHGTNKKASWCGGVVVAGGCKEGPGAVGMWWLGIKWSSNRAPRFCMVKSELHFNFD